MSATMKEELFSEYFGKCPIVYVSGRTFPVQDHFIGEVHDLIARGQHMQAAESGKIVPPQDTKTTGGSKKPSRKQNLSGIFKTRLNARFYFIFS